MNKTIEQWALVSAEHCAVINSVAANMYLIRDAQEDIAELARRITELETKLEIGCDE